MNDTDLNFDINEILKDFRPPKSGDNMQITETEYTELPEPLTIHNNSLEKASEPGEQTDSSFTNDIEFDIKFRGYDRLQVDHYIDAITEDYNAICEKCDALEKENEGLRKALASLNREAVT